MNQILEDIKNITGVCYTCVYSATKGIVAKNVSQGRSIGNLENAVKTVAKVYSDGGQYYDDIEKISFRFEELCIIASKITKKAYIIVVHEQETDDCLLDMTISQCAKKIKERASACEKKPCAQDQAGDTTKLRAPSLRIESLLKTDEISAALLVMEKMLNKVMGPIAAIVFNDSLNEWIKKSRERNDLSIDLLASLLFFEINDPEKIETYKGLIDPHIKTLRGGITGHT